MAWGTRSQEIPKEWHRLLNSPKYSTDTRHEQGCEDLNWDPIHLKDGFFAQRESSAERSLILMMQDCANSIANNGFVQDCSISSALALEIPQSRTEALMWFSSPVYLFDFASLCAYDLSSHRAWHFDFDHSLTRCHHIWTDVFFLVYN